MFQDFSMSLKKLVSVGITGGLALIFASTGIANAVGIHQPQELYGQWRNPQNGDSYRFYRNKTYLFQAGMQKRKSGNLSHQGYWTLLGNDDSDDTSPIWGTTLRLRAASRRVLAQGQVRTRPAHRVFDLICLPAYRNVPPETPVYLSHSTGRYYYREAKDPMKVHWLGTTDPRETNRVFIGTESFRRIR